MAYEPKKDVEMESVECGDLQVTIHSYNKGKPKLQISRAYVSDKEEGVTKFGKAGRLSEEDFDEIIAKAGTIKNAIRKANKKLGKEE